METVKKRQALRYDLSQLSDDIRKEVTAIVKGDTKAKYFTRICSPI